MGSTQWRDVAVVTVLLAALVVLTTGAPVGASPASAGGPVAATAPGGLPVVDTGSTFSCGLHPDGGITCWGSNNNGAARPPAGTFIAVSSGRDHTCAVRTAGSLACWGANLAGQSSPPTTGAYASVSAGAGVTCARRTDSTLTCWGGDWAGMTAAPSGTFTEVGVGSSVACALRSDATITCWGDPADGKTSAPAGSFRSLAVGDDHACAIALDDLVTCWGKPYANATVAPPGPFATIAAGWSTSCGVRPDASITCWGAGVGAEPPSGGFASVSVSGHGCGVRLDGTVACWGPTDWRGLLTPPSSEYRAVYAGQTELCTLDREANASCSGSDPEQPTVPGGPFTEIDTDQLHSCGRRPTGEIECWGENYAGATDAPSGRFRTLSTGLKNGCAVRLDLTLTCWGYDYGGKSTPPGGTFVDVSAGFLHTCGLRTDRHVTCWGSMGGTPVPVSTTFASISAGSAHACGIRFDATVACWGDDHEGSTTPPSGRFTSIASGGGYSCGIRTEGTLACWGSNWTDRATPPAGTYTALSVGDDHACARRVDGVFQCWGNVTIIGEPFEPIIAPTGSGYHPVPPTRLLDSRFGNGFSAKVVSGSPRSLRVTARGGEADVPLDASSVVLNVTVTESAAESFLTAFPTGSPMPTTSNLNFAAGQTVPNLVTVRVGVGGQIDLATAVGATHVVADLVGFYDSGLGAGDGFIGIDPVRVLDSRTSTGGWAAPLVTGAPRDLVVAAGSTSVPPNATAVAANITVTGGTAQSYVTVWPSGRPQPTASTLNLLPGQAIANLAVVGIGTGGAIRFANAAGGVHVIVDVVGYYVPGGGGRFHAIEPTRFLDTRAGLGLAGPQGAGQVRSVRVAGRAGTRVPVEATGLVANITIAEGTAETFLAVFPGGQARPDPFSNLNAGANQVVPNLAIVELGATGDLGVYNHLGSAAVIGDATGYFAPT